MRRLDWAWLPLGLCAAAQAEPLPGLLAAGPAPGHERELSLFMPFIGHWDYGYRFYGSDGRVREEGRGTWDFSWVLAGRSVQDVQTFRDSTGRLSEFGSTLRIPLKDGPWRVVWDGPMRGNSCVLEARSVGDTIQMDGTCNRDPALERWIFSDIGARRFEWHGYLSTDGGQHWTLEEAISARRAAPEQAGFQ